jgi:hypothetical protein
LFSELMRDLHSFSCELVKLVHAYGACAVFVCMISCCCGLDSAAQLALSFMQFATANVP